MAEDATRTWLEIRGDRFDRMEVHPKPVNVDLGGQRFEVSLRSRRAGNQIDNAFAGRKECWVAQDGVDVGWLDTPPFTATGGEFRGMSTWADRDEEGNPGVEGAIGHTRIWLAKPGFALLKWGRTVPITMGVREFRLRGGGRLYENGILVARLGAWVPKVAAAADRDLQVLAVLLVASSARELVTTRVNQRGASWRGQRY